MPEATKPETLEERLIDIALLWARTMKAPRAFGISPQDFAELLRDLGPRREFLDDEERKTRGVVLYGPQGPFFVFADNTPKHRPPPPPSEILMGDNKGEPNAA